VVAALSSARVGQREIAQAAGVSMATVSNVLNRPEVVSPRTRARIEEAIERLGFVHNEAAASLKRGTNRLIGLVVPDITNPFYSEIARGVTAAADAAGYGIVLCNSDDDSTTEHAQFEMLARLRAVGALVVPLTADLERLERLRHVGTHLVLIDRIANSHDGCSAAIDDVLGGEIAAKHLLDTVGQRLALVNGPQSIPQCADRREGMRRAMAASGAGPDSITELVVEEMTIQSGFAAVRTLLENGTDLPSGFVCTNDQLAIGVIRGLTERGIKVPDDIAVVGYGDLSVAEQALIPLTTVRQPKNDLGRAAVALILDEIDDPNHEHSTSVFEPSLVIRRSAPGLEQN
jgi:LacI family transcriptional regulator